MKLEDLILARKTAESAVNAMADGALKVAAFETILRKLLDGSPDPTSRAKTTRQVSADSAGSGTKSRIVALITDGFLAQPRSLAEIQGALAERAWHYPQHHLSTPLTRLVRQRTLRRTRGSEGQKKIWKYSIY